MSWPYRNYSTYLGRWLQAEKLGMIPNDNKQINPFGARKQYEQGLTLYEYCRSNPLINVDPKGMACWVWFDCYLVNSVRAGCKRHCDYQCVETRHEDHGGGDVDCGMMPHPMVRPDYRRKSSLLCRITRGRCGKPGKCKRNYGKKAIYWTTAEMPGRGCSKEECMDDCDSILESVLEACCLAKTPEKKLACKAAAYIVHSVCVLACDVWCQN